MPADELLIGSVRTRASDTFVTDSAASATAYSAGVKTYNGGMLVRAAILTLRYCFER
jgi:alkaline phosphatase